MGIVDTPFYVRNGFGYDRGFQDFLWLRGQGDARRMEERVDARSTWRHESDRWVARTTTAAEEWLERHYEEQFFLLVDVWDPHEPWNPPDYYTKLYAPDYDGRETETCYDNWRDAGLTEDDVRLSHATYCGEVTMVDRWVGRLLEKLDVLGIADNTVLVFVSDHGYYFGEHDYLGKSVWDAGPRHPELVAALPARSCEVPLLVQMPGVEARRTSALTTLVDVPATMLDLAGVEPPPGIAGRSLAPVLRGETDDASRARRQRLAARVPEGADHDRGRLVAAAHRARPAVHRHTRDGLSLVVGGPRGRPRALRPDGRSGRAPKHRARAARRGRRDPGARPSPTCSRSGPARSSSLPGAAGSSGSGGPRSADARRRRTPRRHMTARVGRRSASAWWRRPGLSAQDAIAGLSVAVVVIPQSLAYAQVAGMPPYRGLYAAAVPPLVAAPLASSPYVQPGPTAISALLTFGALSPLAPVGSLRYVELGLLLALMVGVVRVAVGLLHAGVLAYLMSQPLLVGFVPAAAILIVATQLPVALGVGDARAHDLYHAGWALAHPGAWNARGNRRRARSLRRGRARQASPPVLPGRADRRRRRDRLREARRVRRREVGSIHAGLPPLTTSLPLGSAPQLVVPALVIALLGFAEASSIARTYATLDRKRWDANREFVSQGVANVAAGRVRRLPGRRVVLAQRAEPARGRAHDARAASSRGSSSCLPARSASCSRPLPQAVLAATVIVAVVPLDPARPHRRDRSRLPDPVHDHDRRVRADARARAARRACGDRGFDPAVGRDPPLARAATRRRRRPSEGDVLHLRPRACSGSAPPRSSTTASSTSSRPIPRSDACGFTWAASAASTRQGH